eukprot:gene14865-16409_t
MIEFSTDDNECRNRNLCTCDDTINNPSCNATCQNTVGSFRCLCSAGYRTVGSTRCVDTNECMHNHGGCSQLCTNTPGSRICSCRSGFVPRSNGTTCNGSTPGANSSGVEPMQRKRNFRQFMWMNAKSIMVDVSISVSINMEVMSVAVKVATFLILMERLVLMLINADCIFMIVITLAITTKVDFTALVVMDSY